MLESAKQLGRVHKEVILDRMRIRYQIIMGTRIITKKGCKNQGQNTRQEKIAR